jgi:serine/threonine protein kinase
MIGEQFGNYRAVSLLGEGGMGAVYLAEHPGIGRRVAVKVLHKNYTRDESLLGRFLNEARAANAIRHPNIIEILDSGVLGDGTPFLVMELLEGESLGARLRKTGALPISTALDFAYQTASALGAAHKKGIVHRDLKPDNLYVVPDPNDSERERIKVLDFGIAKLQQGSGGADSVKTRTGTLMGTPIYMSPEQCRGTKAVDHRSDMYSLGVIFYEMLVGHPPFVSEGFGELVNMHLNVTPTPPRNYRPDVPESLDAMVMKMLAKNPDERYPDMPTLQAALKAAGPLYGLGVSSSPDITASPRAPAAAAVKTAPSNPKLSETTLNTGAAERLDVPRASGGRAKWIGAALVLTLGAGGYLAFSGNHGGGAVATGPDDRSGTTSKPATTTPAPLPKPPTTATPAPASATTLAPKPVPAVKKVTLKLTSDPAGARVVDDNGDEVLGETPLVLTRPTGGALKVRFEKEGYGPATRTISLDSDHTIELDLDPKPKPKAHKPRPPRESNEPAKL